MAKKKEEKEREEKEREEKDREEKEREEKEREKEKKAVHNFLNQNIIRKAAHYLYNVLHLEKITPYYSLIHDILIAVLTFIILFETNVFHLILILIIVSLDAFSIVVLNKCPLTLLEEKYLKKSSCDIRCEALKELGINYNTDQVYEIQIELMVNVWMLIVFKCLILISLQIFNIKLLDFSGIYKSYKL